VQILVIDVRELVDAVEVVADLADVVGDVAAQVRFESEPMLDCVEAGDELGDRADRFDERLPVWTVAAVDAGRFVELGREVGGAGGEPVQRPVGVGSRPADLLPLIGGRGVGDDPVGDVVAELDDRDLDAGGLHGGLLGSQAVRSGPSRPRPLR